MATALLDYGRRIQESVFLASLDEDLYARMLERVERLMSEAEDTVHVFGLCEGCGRRVVVRGKAELPVDRDFYIL
jgi:CRISPR-associated endonuclease Cas2